MTARTAGRRIRSAKDAGRQAARSGWLALLARNGLAARGVVYILIGVIALEVAFGHSGKQADQSGALRLVASNAVGEILLWVLVVAFAGLALWRLTEAVYGSAEPGGHKAGKRRADEVGAGQVRTSAVDHRIQVKFW